MHPHNLTLHALNNRALWNLDSNNVTTAECYRHLLHYDGEGPFLPNKFKHDVPHPDCTCGIYARYFPNDLEDLFPHQLKDFYVRGVVQVSGNIELGTRGLRVAKAKIIAIAPRDTYDFGMIYGSSHREYSDRIKMLADVHGIEYYRDFRQLARCYPPTNLKSLIYGDDETVYSHSYELDYARAIEWLQHRPGSYHNNRLNFDENKFYTDQLRIMAQMKTTINMKDIIKNLGV